MKLKILSLFFLLIIGTYGFSEDVFLSGGFSAAPGAQLTAFEGRIMKLQPALAADGFLRLNFSDSLYTGLSGGIFITFPSDVSGGWTYPGFTGFETSFLLGMRIPDFSLVGFEAALSAGWYGYNLTYNMFFLPSALFAPSVLIFEDNEVGFFAELPVKYYFHQQADFFMSTALRLKAVLK